MKNIKIITLSLVSILLVVILGSWLYNNYQESQINEENYQFVRSTTIEMVRKANKMNNDNNNKADKENPLIEARNYQAKVDYDQAMSDYQDWLNSGDIIAVKPYPMQPVYEDTIQYIGFDIIFDDTDSNIVRNDNSGVYRVYLGIKMNGKTKDTFDDVKNVVENEVDSDKYDMDNGSQIEIRYSVYEVK